MVSGWENATLGAIVARDYRSAAVLDGFGLDFCAGGKRTLDEACALAGIATAQVVGALEAIGPSTSASEMPDASWSVPDLVRHIVDRHHAYVRAQLPVIAGHLARLRQVHAETHPELATVERRFAQVADELRLHLVKEEDILFPFIRALAASATGGEPPPPNMFGTVGNPIRMMELEHQSAGKELDVMRALTGNFTCPADGCPTFGVCMEELEAFDRDLRTHVHLENNVLFPKALALEAALMKDVA